MGMPVAAPEVDLLSICFLISDGSQGFEGAAQSRKAVPNYIHQETKVFHVSSQDQRAKTKVMVYVVNKSLHASLCLFASASKAEMSSQSPGR